MTARAAAPAPATSAALGLDGAGTTSPRRAALVAGTGYAAIFILAVFANFLVLEGVRGAGDAAEVAQAVADQELLVRAGAVAFLVVALLDVAVAWALHVLLAPVHRDLSLLAAWLRLTHAVLMGAATAFLFLAAALAGAEQPASAPAQRAEQVVLLLDAFDVLWLIGLMAFGGHLVLLARLLLRSGRAPKVLAGVLALAGAAYVADTLARFLLVSYDDHAAALLVVVAVPSVLGELGLTVWLLARAGRAPWPVAADRALLSHRPGG